MQQRLKQTVRCGSKWTACGAVNAVALMAMFGGGMPWQTMADPSPAFAQPAMVLAASESSMPASDVAVVMPGVIRRMQADGSALRRFYDLPVDPISRGRLDGLYAKQLKTLDGMDYAALNVADRIDWHLMRTSLLQRQHALLEETKRDQAMADVLPFASAIVDLENARRALKPLDAQAAAEQVAGVAAAAKKVTAKIKRAPSVDVEANAADFESRLESVLSMGMFGDAEAVDGDALYVSPVKARRAAEKVEALRRTLNHWHAAYADFDPQAAWWLNAPQEEADAALHTLAKKLREDIAGLHGKDDDPLVGDPIGRAELVAQLGFEWLSYSPEALIEKAEGELAWCHEQMSDAATEMGLAGDWQAALEKVKQNVTAPGEQGDLVAGLAEEAVAFLDDNALVSIPDLCRETWRVEMLSRQEQRYLPFAAYGGQNMLVAAPTMDMDHDAKAMAMRGNNIHFTRNVTPHELMPGHHLQGFMAERFATERRGFRTPFLVEGWSLHWELLFYEKGWAQSPEDRIGMLFWRAHRAARIIVSLKFHLNQMSPEAMVDFLVEEVGHEKDSATSEVRRFIGDSYGPLYQCGYLVGGKQLSALRQDLVVDGDWTDRDFHDAVLKQNAIPVGLIRAALMGTPLSKDAKPAWDFWPTSGAASSQ